MTAKSNCNMTSISPDRLPLKPAVAIPPSSPLVPRGAIRAVDLLDNDSETKDLAGLMKPHVHKAAMGAWMPDKQDAKLGGSWNGNHVFKMAFVQK